VPAHITVLAPFVPPTELDAEVEDEVRSMFAGFPAFDYQLANPARFPRVLYLAPEPADLFRAMTESAFTRFPQHPPYEGVFDDVVPHLTVVDCTASAACEDPGAVMDTVERDIVGSMPIRARAHDVWLMVGDGSWSIRARYPLGG
jgi:hypothetical protein